MTDPTIPNTKIETLVGYRRDDEIMGDYVRAIHEHLTLEDVQAIIKKANLYSPKASTKLFAAHKVADHVSELAGYEHGGLAHWAALGVETLTGTIISLAEFKTPRPYGPPTAPFQTLAELRRIVEEEIEDAEAVENPWSDENKAVVRAWVAQTPYQIWTIIHDLEEHAEEAVRESMFDIAREQEDGHSVADIILRHWNHKLMSNWERNWKSRWDGSIPSPVA